MKPISRYIAFSLALCLLLGQGGPLWGGAFDNPAVGSKAASMGSAFTGIADDASAVYYNPAGLVFKGEPGWDLQIYSYMEYKKNHYKTGGVSDISRSSSFYPGAFLSYQMEDWAFGGGLYTPFSSSPVDYDNFQKGGSDLEYIFGMGALTASAAYQLTSRLSAGAGVSLYAGGMESKVTNTFTVDSDYSDVAGYGANLGLIYQPADALTLGFSVKSGFSAEMDGDTKINGAKNDSDLRFKMPWSYTLGIGFEVDEHTTLGLDVVRTMWDDMDHITTKTGPTALRFPTHYRDNWSIGAGMERRLSPECALRAGLLYMQNATKDRGLDPQTNDVDRLIPSVGATYTLDEGMWLDFSGFYSYGYERSHDGEKFDQDGVGLMVGFNCLF